MNNKLEQLVIKYLNKFYGNLEEHTTDEYPDIMFFIKGKKIYMEQDLESGRLLVEYHTIWTDLETIFGLEAPEIQEIITKWVKETYKLRGVTPNYSGYFNHNGWNKLII